MNSIIKSKPVALSLIMLGMLFPSIAMADCDDLDNNSEWINGLKEIKSQLDKGEFQKAVDIAKPMYGICQDSPTLMYYTGLGLLGTGDKERAAVYFQKASENTTHFNVEAGLSRQIWYARYEAEHPDRTEQAVAAQTAKVESLQSTIDSQKENIAELTNELTALSLISANQSDVKYAAVKNNAGVTMWTGTAVGIVGILLTTGGFLMAHYVDNKTDNGSSFQISPQYIAGWSMFGGGLGMLIAGAITAGIGGYQYTHADTAGTYSFSITPTSASFGMTF